MKKAFLFLVTIIACQNLYAGDAGYASETCTSESGRTVLTTYDAYAGEDTRIYTLIIDGLPAIYDLRDEHNEEIGDDGYLEIHSEGSPVFTIDKFEGTITVFQDPRQGFLAMNNAAPTPLRVKVNCKFYSPAP
jgi:hypothetical protein